jgi:hypothetical protein
MLDHLTRTRHAPDQRTAAGVGVSIALHLAVIVLLAYGIGTAARESGSVPMEEISGTASGERQVGIGGPEAVSRYSVPPLDLRAAELGPRVAARLPDTLELGRAVPIHLMIAPEQIAPDSVLHLRTPAGGPIELRLSRTREATLHGPAFVVEPLTPAMQVADRARPTEWLWTVTPTKAGTQPLSLRIDAIASVDRFERVVTLATLPGEVFVRTTAIQRASRFFSHHWTWLSLLTLVALVGWARAMLDRRAAA